MKLTKEQLITALSAEYEYLCHDDFDPDMDVSPEDYRVMLTQMSMNELIEETSTGEHFSLEEYLNTWTS